MYIYTHRFFEPEITKKTFQFFGSYLCVWFICLFCAITPTPMALETWLLVHVFIDTDTENYYFKFWVKSWKIQLDQKSIKLKFSVLLVWILALTTILINFDIIRDFGVSLYSTIHGKI